MTKLTLKDRYYVNMYIRSLPCTIKFYKAFDKFIEQIDLSAEEVAQYEVKFDTTVGFTSNSDDKEFEYTFEKELIESVQEYVKMYDHAKNAENAGLQKRLVYLKKIIG
jgi:hypothetical protein